MTNDELDALEAKAREGRKALNWPAWLRSDLVGPMVDAVLALSAALRRERAARIEAERWRDEVRGELAAARKEIAETRAKRA